MKGTPWGCLTNRETFVIRFNPDSGYPRWSVIDTRTDKAIQSYKFYLAAEYCLRAMNLYESGNVEEAGKRWDWAYRADKSDVS